MVLSLFAIPTVVTHLPNIYQEPDNVYDLTWPSLQPCEADIIPPILWLRILRLKEMNTPAQDHTAGVQHSWDGKLGTCDRQAISRNVQHEESHLLHSRSCTCSKAASELLGFLGSHSMTEWVPGRCWAVSVALRTSWIPQLQVTPRCRQMLSWEQNSLPWPERETGSIS